jgi:hypothetical protein
MPTQLVARTVAVSANTFAKLADLSDELITRHLIQIVISYHERHRPPHAPEFSCGVQLDGRD